ncbi:MAG TPA: HAMP domain-containing sensor histidine kinase [Myxococcota bacterium]|nr:HAMP domain-containing sensor histidine kinase [Myxococcota bacterium]
MAERFDINAIAREAIRGAGLDRDRHVALRASLFDPPPEVRGSREQLTAAIACLLRSARRSVAGREGAAIDLETEPDGDRIAIRILDNGPGLSEDELERIFDPFVAEPGCVDAPDSKHSRGLAGAGEVFRDHGGTLMVRSRPGEGTCFVALLPIAPA